MSSQLRSQIRLKGLALIYASLFGIIVVLAYTGNLPAQLAIIPYYDKFGHVILYGVAAYLGHRLLSRFVFKLGRYRLPVWVLSFTIWTFVEEGMQFFAPTRSLDLMDLVCSVLGIVMGYGLAQRELGRQNKGYDDWHSL